jgi:hypothetical protein
MKSVLRSVIAVGLGLCVGCSTGERVSPDIEEKQPLHQFLVRIGDREITVPAALLVVHHYSDGRSTATVAFQAGADDQEVSVSVEAPLSIIEQRQFDSPVRAQPGQGTGTTLVIGGRLATQGRFSAVIADAGRLSGSVEGADVRVSFSGLYAVSCFVAPAVLGKATGAPVEAPSSGSPVGEVLVQDVNFVSTQCSSLKQRLDLL